MEKSKIKELLAPFVGENALNAAQLEQVSAYLDLLLKWNAKMNLTAVRAPEEIITRHFGESFSAAALLLGGANSKTASVIDLGSGAGFPGLPIAIYAPKSRVTLIESQNKKATFLKEVVRSAGVHNATVFVGRGEDYTERAELVTLRAVERFASAVRTAAELVTPAGRLGLMIGVEQAKTLPSGFAWEVGKAVPGTRGRVVAVGTKMGESS